MGLRRFVFSTLAVFAVSVAFYTDLSTAQEPPYETNIIFQTKNAGTQFHIDETAVMHHQDAAATSDSGGESGQGSGAGGSTSGNGGTGGNGNNGLPPNQVLLPGMSTKSPNGRFRLTYETNGNLVLYGPKGRVWASNTQGAPGQVTMRLDGNLVIYDASHAEVWSTSTGGHPGAQLSVQDNGDLVVYDRDGRRLWHSDTTQPDEPPRRNIPAGGTGEGGGPQAHFSNEAQLIGLINRVAGENPGMINDCTGHPYATNFLIKVVRELQKYDRRWGFFVKSDRIPRDIVAYAYGAERQGTHNTFVIDFITSGCDNDPHSPDYQRRIPMPGNNEPGIWFNVTNASGFAPNGIWSFDP